MWSFAPDEIEAIRLSLKVALWATFGSLPLGLFVAYALARWNFPGKLLLDGIIHLPLVMPPVATDTVTSPLTPPPLRPAPAATPVISPAPPVTAKLATWVPSSAPSSARRS